jgi:hypothetical protein
MAEDEDLEVLASADLALLATADEETGKGADDEVEERPHRPIVPGLSERESGFPTLTGYPESLPNVEIAGRSGEARRVAQRVAGFGGLTHDAPALDQRSGRRPVRYRIGSW